MDDVGHEDDVDPVRVGAFEEVPTEWSVGRQCGIFDSVYSARAGGRRPHIRLEKRSFSGRNRLECEAERL